MKTPKLILISALFLLANTLSAQVMNKNFGSTFSLAAGYTNINLDNLQGIIPNEAASLKNNYASFGIGYNLQFKGYIAGIHGEFLQSGTRFKDLVGKNDGDITTRSGVSKATVNFGYALVDMPRFRFFPTVGVGHSRFNLNITNEGNFTPAQIKNGEMGGNEYNLTVKNILFDFALNFNYLIGKEKDGLTKGIIKGVKVGYQLGIKNDNWKHSGGDLNEAPDFSPDGFYVQAVFGFGKFSPTKEGLCSHKEKL